MTPEEQITETLKSLKILLHLKGWPNARRQDLDVVLARLEVQWQAYQAGTLAALALPEV